MRIKKRSGRHLSRQDSSHGGFYTPFADLKKRLATRASRRDERGSSHHVTQASNDLILFHQAMADVQPLRSRNKIVALRLPPRKPVPRFSVEQERQVITYLNELVNGERKFDLTVSDEYIEGAVAGISPEIMRRLRRGEFSWQGYLDLHGYRVEEARDKVTAFLLDEHFRGVRCVLVICGRGLNSKNYKPVLKYNLVKWLTHSPLRQIVLAFSSAKSYDGGVGALYVLLRRRREKSPIILR